MASQRSAGYSRVDPEELLASLGLVAALIWTALVAGRIVVLLYASLFVVVFPHLWAFERAQPFRDAAIIALCYNYTLTMTAAALVFLYYAAWKRELVPAGWGIAAVGTWTLAALVWIALTPLGDTRGPGQEGFMLPGFLALCATTPLWPPPRPTPPAPPLTGLLQNWTARRSSRGSMRRSAPACPAFRRLRACLPHARRDKIHVATNSRFCDLHPTLAAAM